MSLANDIQNILDQGGHDHLIEADFRARLKHGALTRDENPTSHFCASFLPFDPVEKKVFLIAHKGAGLWLSPGGHIEPGETLLEALNREIHEELGLENQFASLPTPLMISTDDIDLETYTCKKHYDTWFIVETDGLNFHVDPEEFNETRWVTREEALALLTDESNIRAINKVLPA